MGNPNVTSTLIFGFNFERTSDYNKFLRGSTRQELTLEKKLEFANVLLNGGEIEFEHVFPRFMRSLPSGTAEYFFFLIVLSFLSELNILYPLLEI